MLCVCFTSYPSFSRKVVWLEVSTTNNDSAVIARYFRQWISMVGSLYVFITLCFVLKVVLGLYGETVAPRTAELLTFSHFYGVMEATLMLKKVFNMDDL